MTLDRARELLMTQAGFGGGYNRHGTRLILADVTREHGQEAADRLIRDLGLEDKFGIVPGSRIAP